MYVAVSHIASIHRFCGPVPVTLCFPLLEVLLPNGGTLPRRHSNDSTELEIKTVAQPLWTAHSLNPQAYCADYQGETGLEPTNRHKGEYVWSMGDPLVSLMAYALGQWKPQQPNPDGTTNDPDPSRMKVLVTPPGEETVNS